MTAVRVGADQRDHSDAASIARRQHCSGEHGWVARDNGEVRGASVERDQNCGPRFGHRNDRVAVTAGTVSEICGGREQNIHALTSTGAATWG